MKIVWVVLVFMYKLSFDVFLCIFIHILKMYLSCDSNREEL